MKNKRTINSRRKNIVSVMNLQSNSSKDRKTGLAPLDGYLIDKKNIHCLENNRSLDHRIKYGVRTLAIKDPVFAITACNISAVFAAAVVSISVSVSVDYPIGDPDTEDKEE